MLLDPPDVWVPVLAVILDRCRGQPRSDLGGAACGWSVLVSSRPGSIPSVRTSSILDTQMLEQYLKRYGPRVTTATGELGVAASQSEIWTPEATGHVPRRSGHRAQPAAPGAGAEKSKLILPGQ